MKHSFYTAVAITALLTMGCKDETKPDPGLQGPVKTDTQTETKAQAKQAGPTIQEAKEFLDSSAKKIEERLLEQNKAGWVKYNFITVDTQWLEAKANERYANLATQLSKQAKRFNSLKTLPADMLRKLDIIKRLNPFPAPDKPGAAAELSTIMADLSGRYGSGKFKVDGKTLDLGAAVKIIAHSRDPKELQKVWEGWRTISPPMKKEYARMVELINEGARELGYNDTGHLWKAGYDMPPEDFTKEVDRLWTQVKPLYNQLHCYVRAELNKKYGDEVVPLDKPIRADLLGNMWAQSWSNIYDIVKPENDAKNVDITPLLEKAGYDRIKMVKTGEAFFTSLGFDPLPKTFWERSLFKKPRDREVVCHASAWDIDDKDDIRIKMCINITGEDFTVIHHELGHNFYQRAYKDQPVYYRNGANDGFHEAIGDTITLSITPDYLVKIGLLDPEDVPGPDADINLLLQKALDKVAFLPFGIMIDKWRWNVFNGTYKPEDYNKGWWELREKYQGIRPPSERPANAFDPGAKYHIPGNTPYMRYFLAHILQFQFHRAACRIAENDGPLHLCSIYGNKEVGKRFNAMLEMGMSRPWPDELEAFTGERQMDATAIVDYFAPLMEWLKVQNKDRKCGW